jgi:hypothetical protein
MLEKKTINGQKVTGHNVTILIAQKVTLIIFDLEKPLRQTVIINHFSFGKASKTKSHN